MKGKVNSTTHTFVLPSQDRFFSPRPVPFTAAMRKYHKCNREQNRTIHSMSRIKNDCFIDVLVIHFSGSKRTFSSHLLFKAICTLEVAQAWWSSRWFARRITYRSAWLARRTWALRSCHVNKKPFLQDIQKILVYNTRTIQLQRCQGAGLYHCSKYL